MSWADEHTRTMVEWAGRARRAQAAVDMVIHDHLTRQGIPVKSRFEKYGRYDDAPDQIGCPRAQTDMTPCVARDGSLATGTDRPTCVGCDVHPAVLLQELVRAVTEPLPTGAEAQTIFAWKLRDMAALAEDRDEVGLGADQRTDWVRNLTAAANLIESQAARVIELEQAG